MDLKSAFDSLDLLSREELANFCGTSLRTVKTWGVSCLPRGSYLVSAIVFLVAKKDLHIDGYEKEQRYFKAMALLGFKLLSTEELADLLEYKDAFDVFDFMVNRHGLSAERERRLTTILSSLSSQLDAVLGKSATSVDSDGLIENFAVLTGLLSKMEPELNFLLASSPEKRKAFREDLEGRGITIFKTSNALYRVTAKFNSLCSEKTLKEKTEKTTRK